MSGRRIAVVGHCASGKSTVVAALRERGLDAWAVAQEHSAIGDLWRHQSPDVLIFLDVGLDSIRARRGDPRWPEWIYDVQSERLADARQHADFLIPTDTKPVDAIVDQIIASLGD